MTDRQHHEAARHPAVVAVADCTTSKWDSWAATYLPKMKSAGYGDVLGRTYASSTSRPRAAVLDRAWVNSCRDYRGDARRHS